MENININGVFTYRIFCHKYKYDSIFVDISEFLILPSTSISTVPANTEPENSTLPLCNNSKNEANQFWTKQNSLILIECYKNV